MDRKIKVHCCVRRYNNSTCTTRGEKGLRCIPVRFDVYNALTKGSADRTGFVSTLWIAKYFISHPSKRLISIQVSRVCVLARLAQVALDLLSIHTSLKVIVHVKLGKISVQKGKCNAYIETQFFICKGKFKLNQNFLSLSL